MATGGHFNEHAAYAKLLLRLIMCGTKVMRRLLSDQIKQYRQTTDSFLASRKQVLLKDMVGKMNKSVLFPLNSQPTKIESWDICLLAHVLVTSCHHLPQKVVENLQKLRQIRNDIAHSEDATLSETQFNDLWTKTGHILADAMAVVNDKDFFEEIQHDVKCIENGRFFHDVAEYQKVINQWCQLDPHFVQKLDEIGKGEYQVLSETTLLISIRI